MEPHKIVDFAIQLAVILFAISFHESAHAWTALKFGDTTAGTWAGSASIPSGTSTLSASILVPILLYFFSGLIFGAAKPTPVDLRRTTRNPRMANLAVSAAGPLSNLLLATVGIVHPQDHPGLGPVGDSDLYTALSENRFASGALAPIAYVLFIFVLVNVSLGRLQPAADTAPRRKRRGRLARRRRRRRGSTRRSRRSGS